MSGCLLSRVGSGTSMRLGPKGLLSSGSKHFQRAISLQKVCDDSAIRESLDAISSWNFYSHVEAPTYAQVAF
jgi:hypothetical protein